MAHVGHLMSGPSLWREDPTKYWLDLVGVRGSHYGWSDNISASITMESYSNQPGLWSLLILPCFQVATRNQLRLEPPLSWEDVRTRVESGWVRLSPVESPFCVGVFLEHGGGTQGAFKNVSWSWEPSRWVENSLQLLPEAADRGAVAVASPQSWLKSPRVGRSHGDATVTLGKVGPVSWCTTKRTRIYGGKWWEYIYSWMGERNQLMAVPKPWHLSPGASSQRRSPDCPQWRAWMSPRQETGPKSCCSTLLWWWCQKSVQTS